MTTVTPNSAPDSAFAYADILAKWNIPGAAIALLENGEITTQVAGLASIEQETPVDAETVFGIGSISKVFTATLAVALADAGKLDLDAPVIEVFPELALADPATRATLTMRHLLTHTGGFEGDGFKEIGNDAASLQRFVSAFGDLEQVAAPGAYWSYSNNGFGLAGAVIERASGLSYEDAMRHYVLDPLGMSRTGFGQPPTLPNTATGYEFGATGERETRDPAGVDRSANPAGGMMSTVGDLLRFGQFHLGLSAPGTGRVMSEASRQAMQETQVRVNESEVWGIGWEKRRLEGDGWMVEHGGWYNGFRAQLTLIPEQNAALSILTNGPLGHAAIEDIQRALLADRFGVHEAELPAIAISADAASRYLGTYKQSHIDVWFTADEGEYPLTMHLKTAWHGEANDAPLVSPLRAVGDGEFTVVGGEFDASHITFLTNDAGDIEFVRVLNRLCRPTA